MSFDFENKVLKPSKLFVTLVSVNHIIKYFRLLKKNRCRALSISKEKVT